MSSQRHYFWSGVTDTHPRDPRVSPKYTNPRGRDTKIALRYHRISGRSWINAPDATVFDVPNLIARKLVVVTLSDVKKSDKRSYYIDYMAKQLSELGVPGHEQLDALEKLFDMIDVTLPGRHIIVFLADVTVQLLDNPSNLSGGNVTLPLWINGGLTDNQQIMLQRLMMDFRYDFSKGIPATLSSVQDLEKVRLDSLEPAVRQMECAICIEGLDYFYAAEEGNHHRHMIARLPCSHMYHEDCIAQWLKNNQRCPLCRCTVATSEPPMKLHWSMLMLSAVGLLTATLIPRLFNWRSRMTISPNRVSLSASPVFGL